MIIMDKLLLICILSLVSGCSSVIKAEFCQLPQKQIKTVTAGIHKAIDAISDDSITYGLSSRVTEKGQLFKGVDGCFAILIPKAIGLNAGVEDGEGAIYINMETFEVDRIEWFEY